MIAYNPEMTPDPEAWLALDESGRIQLVEAFHREARISMPKSARALHAAIHTIVENQLAQGEQAIVQDTLQQLLADGLTRHEAIHAIGPVLAELIIERFHQEPGAMNGNG